ncbi:PLP-dependent aminotransferase family protein [Candidatus Poribacteria bacterium]|nr:PLP-dependent aminotransferase family protein [Candidatus Poribacteria bacterium]MBT5536301.1 PLP-dependent aminotransferase family protein [Candidatus Poribacteria bacterium]MBT5710241.1 PLP-dependent aminotransferase family protein [Candidatus Poribacteria bacterium]MBT7096138.1 PLP-dependent aminotransferase family protein [Candidatus Poribacteria bacterium]MBT7804928.1 PLP-dependent aminotransferase family protein [Candidatus Poribacteria bacterium]
MREYNFTGGMPDPGSFPIEGLIEAAGRALRAAGGDTLVHYPGDLGNITLREVAAMRFQASQGTEISPDDIAITNGSMQALELVFRAYVEPGDIVLTEELSYMGTLGLLRHSKANIVGVPNDEHGMNTDALEEILRDLAAKGQRPKLINTVPINHNPTGMNMTAERKRRFIELAEEYDVVILEDECYGDIYFEGDPAPSLYSQAPSGRVIYVATFSKTIGPGVRMGYLSVPQPVMGRIMANRHDGGPSALASLILAEFLRHHMWDHIRKTNGIVREKLATLLAALDENLGDMISCIPPTGGLFAWTTVPEDTDMGRLMAGLDERQVRCTRGQAFHVDQKDIPNVRFSFAYPSLQDIRDGVEVFADCVRAAQPSEAAVA